MTGQVTFCRYALSACLHPGQEARFPRTGSADYRYRLSLAPGHAEEGWGFSALSGPLAFSLHWPLVTHCHCPRTVAPEFFNLTDLTGPGPFPPGSGTEAGGRRGPGGRGAVPRVLEEAPSPP